jgi:hypothetical protein
VKGERIKEDQEYQGVRIHLTAQLDGARIPIQIDIGFGDVVSPGAEEIEYPALLNLPKPHLLVYSRESVIAEKFHAMTILGITNTRMKDFHDIWVLSRKFGFQGKVLAGAIKATFKRRETEIPTEPPLALTKEFYQDPGKQAQWTAFLRRTRIEVAEPFSDIIEAINTFLMPPAKVIAQGQEFDLVWEIAGSWRK